MPGDPAGNSSPGGNEGPGQNAGPGGPGAENGGGAPGPGGEPGTWEPSWTGSIGGVGMRKIEREPHGRGRFVPGQDLVVAGCIGKGGSSGCHGKEKRSAGGQIPWRISGPS